jgi:uncharacterized protein YkwD
MLLHRLDTRFALLAALACVVLGLLLASAPEASAAQACPSANESPTEATRKEMVRSTLCLLNQRRARHGMRKLRLSKNLSKAARRHAHDMARRNYFSHTAPGGKSFLDRIKNTGYLHQAQSWMVGENLAWGSGGRSTPKAIVQAWMNSPGHRANILNARFRHIGIGIVFDAPVNVGRTPAATYATEFGRKA